MAVFGGILAAGAAQRFGAPKLLLPAGPRDTVLSRSVRRLLAAVAGPVLVVLPADAALHEAALAQMRDPRVEAVMNARSAEGLGTSVAAAAGAAAGAGAEGLLLMPADLPYVTEALLVDLLDRFRSEQPFAAATIHADHPQTPAVISAKALLPLAAHGGPRGAQELLAAPGERVVRVAAGPEELRDLDRWPAYAAAARSLGWAADAPPQVSWTDDQPDALPKGAGWVLGSTRACYIPDRVDSGIVARAGRRGATFVARGGPGMALRLLRAAALEELRRGRG